jgi:hypothetical protein
MGFQVFLGVRETAVAGNGAWPSSTWTSAMAPSGSI